MPTTQLDLSPSQLAIIQAPVEAHIFLDGPAAAGKTTAAASRLQFLLENGISGSEILVFLPQRTLDRPYQAVIQNPRYATGGIPEITTLAGLARHSVDLFWPLIAEAAGFQRPEQPPLFLNLETAQFHMARIAAPLLDMGYFEGVTIDRNRLYTQILDNLNKAAFVRFPHTEFGARLNAAWIDQSHQQRLYLDAQTCAERFRQYCLENSLLDFSLTIELFIEHLWPLPECRQYLTGRYRHLIADNLEEDTPATHDLLLEWAPQAQSALLVFDWDAGYRRFLGADPISAQRLAQVCDTHATLANSFVTGEPVESLQASFALFLGRTPQRPPMQENEVLHFNFHRFYPEMLDWVADQIEYLVYERGSPPGEIVVLAPYLSDALRFSIMNRLAAADIPVQSHRPSRSLREEPAARCLLTLAALAHPEWQFLPTVYEAAYAFRLAIDELDAVRAQLLAEILYRAADNRPVLYPFDEVLPEVQERITYVMGGRFDAMRLWLENYRRKPPAAIDHFFGQLFGEVLSQPGFRFHGDLDAGRTAANLVESARQFRISVGPQIEAENASIGKTFIETVQAGALASQFLHAWREQDRRAVFIAPAHTYLMSDRPVDFQFWLNVSSSGWFDRLYQPLTHPEVLSRNWQPGDRWTDKDEVETNTDVLYRLVTGLLRRCRKGIFLGLSELDEYGFEQKGQLLKTVQKILRTELA